MIEKRIGEKYYIQKIIKCDRCKKTIAIDNGDWTRGSFQCGENLQGKIGTWCSIKCFEMYEKLAPLITN